jgi:hypothetical protein
MPGLEARGALVQNELNCLSTHLSIHITHNANSRREPLALMNMQWRPSLAEVMGNTNFNFKAQWTQTIDGWMKYDRRVKTLGIC